MLSGEGLRPGTRTDGKERPEPGTGTRQVVSGRKAGIGLVVRGARIGARNVTEACCEHAGGHASCTRLPRDWFRTGGVLGDDGTRDQEPARVRGDRRRMMGMM